jgi:hypothetical protein
MDNLPNVHGVPNMFGKQNSSQKLENTVVSTPVCVATSLTDYFTCHSQLSETSGKWNILKFFKTQVKQMMLDMFFKKE